MIRFIKFRKSCLKNESSNYLFTLLFLIRYLTLSLYIVK